MKRLMMMTALAACAAAVTGCCSMEVTDYGYEVVRDAEGKPLVDAFGQVQKYHKGQKWDYNKNMVDQSFDDLDFSRTTNNTISIKLTNYKGTVSPELNKVVDTSFKGAAELAAKVGAAIATSGGSVAGDAAYSAIRSSITKFIQRGGDPAKATVTCSGGNCTFTDGKVTETCTDCIVNQ